MATQNPYKSWEEVADNLKGKPELQRVLSSLAKMSKCKKPFVQLDYTYGEFLLEHGTFNFPKSFDNKTEMENLKKHLGLTQPTDDSLPIPRLPIGIVAKREGAQSGVLEASFFVRRYDPQDDRSINWSRGCYPLMEVLPQAILTPGCLFGLFEFFDFQRRLSQPPPYDVAAGCRSVFSTVDMGAPSLKDELNAAFTSCSDAGFKSHIEDEEWRTFDNGSVPLSAMIQRFVPQQVNKYLTTVIFIPLNLLQPDAQKSREFMLQAYGMAWEQASHLRNGFIEILNPKAFVKEWGASSSQVVRDHIESMARFLYKVEWVVKNQIPGFKVASIERPGYYFNGECSAGPFGSFIKVFDEVFAKRKTKQRNLFFYPEYYRNKGENEKLFVISRMNRPCRDYGDKAHYLQKVRVAFDKARKCPDGKDLLAKAELLFDSIGQKPLTPEEFGISSDVSIRDRKGNKKSFSCKLYLAHWFFEDGFARLS
jgi:hypothetical protein